MIKVNLLILPIAFLIFISLSPLILAQEKNFTVVPNTVGIGLQKDFDDATFYSSDGDMCIGYHLGNPWSTNVTGWLAVSGDLATYFDKNDPSEVFVPSGTFRYNSSCCLLPIYICFKFPYVMQDTTFTGKVYSAFRVEGSSPSSGGTGSATGSSTSYSLAVILKPSQYIALNAGERKCINFYQVGEQCFNAPWIVLSDYQETKDVNGHPLSFKYSNNLLIIVLICVVVVILALALFYFLQSSHSQLQSEPQTQVSEQLTQQ